jgi:hypothetical protein
VRETFRGVSVCSDECYELSAESNRVLDGVKSLEHGKVGIAASRSELLDQTDDEQRLRAAEASCQRSVASGIVLIP